MAALGVSGNSRASSEPGFLMRALHDPNAPMIAATNATIDQGSANVDEIG